MLLFPGALLLEEVVSYCGREGIDAIIDAASKRFNESQQEKAAGSTVWWRVSRELFGFWFRIHIVKDCPVSVVSLHLLYLLSSTLITAASETFLDEFLSLVNSNLPGIIGSH